MSVNTTLSSSPRLPTSLNEVAQRLLAAIPTHLGEYRVFEGSNSVPPLSLTPPTGYGRLRELLYFKLCEQTDSYRAFTEEFCLEEEALGPSGPTYEYLNELERAHAASNEELHVMEDYLNSYADRRTPNRRVNALIGPTFIIDLKAPYDVVEVPSKERDHAAWYRFRYPNAYLKAVPRPSHLTVNQLVGQGLGNLGMTPKIFWRPGMAAGEPVAIEDQTLQDMETFNGEVYQAWMTRQWDAILPPQLVDDDDDSPQSRDMDQSVIGKHAPLVDEHTLESSNAEIVISKQENDQPEDQPVLAVEGLDEVDLMESVEPRPHLVQDTAKAIADHPLTPVSKTKKRSYAEAWNDGDRLRLPPPGEYGSSKLTWGGKTARRSPTPPPSASEESESDADDSDFYEPTPSKKQKRSKKFETKTSTKATSKGARKAIAKGQSAPRQQDSEDDFEDDSEDVSGEDQDSEDSDVGSPLPKKTHNSKLKAKVPPKGARKSTAKVNIVTQQDFKDDSDLKDGIVNNSQQAGFFAAGDVNNLPPAKKSRTSKPKSKASTDEALLPGGWTHMEHDAAEAILRARRALEASDQSLPRFRDETLFKHVSAELSKLGVARLFGSIKNYWNRYGRARSGFEERYGKDGASLVTSAQKPKGTATARVKKA